MAANGRAALLLLLLAAAFAPCAGAQERAPPPASITAETLPRGWCGVFRWHGDPFEQHVTIVFTKVAARPDGRIEATGPGLVRSYRHTKVAWRAVIDPATRRVELFETLLDDTPHYVTDGVHEGPLDADLGTMRLVWTTRRTGKTGAMDLTARPAGADLEQVCGVPSAAVPTRPWRAAAHRQEYRDGIFAIN